jgi:hypothetical protein
VVASSMRRKWVIWSKSPKNLTTRFYNQRISVGPDCGGFEKLADFYFKTEEALIRLCSLRIQAVVSNCSFTFSPATC